MSLNPDINQQQVRNWMFLHADEYDSLTALVEAANIESNLPVSAMDDPNHWVWVLAGIAKDCD